MPEQNLPNLQSNSRYPNADLEIQKNLEDLKSVNFDSETLKKLAEENERSKRASGIVLIFFLLFLLIVVNVLNAVYFRNLEISKYSIIAFFTFFIPTLFTKFDLLGVIIRKFFPYLREPDDFFKRVKELD